MKLLEKANEGFTNAVKSTVIDPAVSLTSAAVGGVGQVMSQPGAGAVLGAAGAAFGVPGVGALAGGLLGNGGQSNAPAPAPTSAPAAPQIITMPSTPSASSNDNTILIIGAVGAGLVLVIALIFGLKKK